jgi:hypothetical protein
MIKSRRMSWAEHVARMKAKRNAYRILVGKPKEIDHQGDQDIGRIIILKWILGRNGGGMDWIYLAQNRDQWRALVNAAMNLRVLE